MKVMLVEVYYKKDGKTVSEDIYREDVQDDNYEAVVLDRIQEILRGGAVVTTISQQRW